MVKGKPKGRQSINSLTSSMNSLNVNFKEKTKSKPRKSTITSITRSLGKLSMTTPSNKGRGTKKKKRRRRRRSKSEKKK